jgi:hypothetical protein
MWLRRRWQTFQRYLLPPPSRRPLDDGGSRYLWNVGQRDYTAEYSRRLSPTYWTPCEPEISTRWQLFRLHSFGWLIKDELGWIWKEAVVVYFKLQYRHLSRGTEKTQKIRHSGEPISGPRLHCQNTNNPLGRDFYWWLSIKLLDFCFHSERKLSEIFAKNVIPMY